MKRADLSADALRALWCVLDADDSNAVQVDEFALFLKGHVDQLLDESRARKKPPEGILHRPNPMRSPKKKKSNDRPEFDKEAYRKQQEEAHSKRLDKLNQRMSDEQRYYREAHKEKERRLLLARQNTEYKQSLLQNMLHSMLKSPIPLHNPTGRIGAQRIVPLYQSERMVAMLERSSSGKAQWPVASPRGRESSPRGMLNSASSGNLGLETRPVRDFDLRTPSASRRLPLPPTFLEPLPSISPGSRANVGGIVPSPQWGRGAIKSSGHDKALDEALGKLEKKVMQRAPGTAPDSPLNSRMRASASMPVLS